MERRPPRTTTLRHAAARRGVCKRRLPASSAQATVSLRAQIFRSEHLSNPQEPPNPRNVEL